MYAWLILYRYVHNGTVSVVPGTYLGCVMKTTRMNESIPIKEMNENEAINQSINPCMRVCEQARQPASAYHTLPSGQPSRDAATRRYLDHNTCTISKLCTTPHRTFILTKLKIHYPLYSKLHTLYQLPLALKYLKKATDLKLLTDFQSSANNVAAKSPSYYLAFNSCRHG